ncbi:ribosomal protein S5 domain 2-type protein [Pilobolus umbonatus]|nr:ribosomal protein S5 domain 2-type protein [Pilobolus umbonatus]
MVNRPDRRVDNTQLRQLSASQNILNRADGSSKFELGSTAVIASVNGPIEVSLRDEKLDEATVEIIVKPAVGMSSIKEKLMESVLGTAFKPVILGGMMPRTLIQIVVQITKDDGCALAACINAITLALLDAGIPMKYMIASTTCIIDKTKEVVLDPTMAELENSVSVHTFAFDNAKPSPHSILFDSDGVFSEEEFSACYELCSQAVEQIHGFLRTAVEAKKEKEQQQLAGQ